MQRPYALGVRLYRLAVAAASLRSAKARDRRLGARDALSILSETEPETACIWMHCASVGEFEQGRPLWEALRKRNPEARYVLTFFSPSGYQQYANRTDVGEVHYLPWDVGNNAVEFVGMLFGSANAARPHLAIFVKYEWWLGYFAALQTASVPTIVISTAFRANQPFFRAWGGAWRKALRNVDQVFVQNAASLALLKRLGSVSAQQVGDTRLDRVVANKSQLLDQPTLTAFAKTQATAQVLLVAGSTWPRDDELLVQALASIPQLSLIVAPHEVGAPQIAASRARYAGFGVSLLSEIGTPAALPLPPGMRVVIIDSIGLLSKLYRLGSLAYIGGGFGAGIHNTLEPVVYGLPIAFGPKHQRFVEAQDLLANGVATEVTDAESLVNWINEHRNAARQAQVLAKAETYIAQHSGATERIVRWLVNEGIV